MPPNRGQSKVPTPAGLAAMMPRDDVTGANVVQTGGCSRSPVPRDQAGRAGTLAAIGELWLDHRHRAVRRMGTCLAARLNHGGMPRTEIARESGDGAIPPWLKVIVVVEELGEAHGAGSEYDRAVSPAFRAIGHRQR